MRVLALETSTSLAGVALLEAGRLVLARSHARPKQSAEQLLPMVAQLLAEAGWQRNDVERIGVSVGPGSFTGLRVGIACAQGLALGLGVPILGVTSLRAMARLVPNSLPGLRCAVLDARRREVFVAAYEAGPLSREVLAPLALPAAGAQQFVAARLGAPLVWVGSGLRLLEATASYDSPETDEPSAHAVGLLAGELDPADWEPLPVYVRDAGATLPQA